MNYNKTLQVGINISQVHWSLQNFINKKLRPNGITLDKLRIMSIVNSNEGCCQQFIADSLFKTKTAIANMTENLVKEDLVIRIQDPDNRRLNKIFLTPEGKNLHDKCISEITDNMEQVFTDIKKEEINNLLKVLEQMKNNIE